MQAHATRRKCAPLLRFLQSRSLLSALARKAAYPYGSKLFRRFVAAAFSRLRNPSMSTIS